METPFDYDKLVEAFAEYMRMCWDDDSASSAVFGVSGDVARVLGLDEERFEDDVWTAGNR